MYPGNNSNILHLLSPGEKPIWEKSGEAFKLVIDKENGKGTLSKVMVKSQREQLLNKDISEEKFVVISEVNTNKNNASNITNTEEFFLRGPFKAGKLNNIERPKLKDCIVKPCTLTLRNEPYIADDLSKSKSSQIDLTAIQIISNYNDDFNPRFAVKIKKNESSIVLPYVSRLIWVGDLDRDNRIDLIYQSPASDCQSYGSVNFYLSSLSAALPMVSAGSIGSDCGC